MQNQNPLHDFELFCQFLGGEKRLPDALLWSFSIAGKTSGVTILYNEVLEQISKCSNEWKEFTRKKYGSRNASLILALRYEAFLNSIYSLCESLSFVVYSLYRAKNLPRGFNEQRSRFPNDDSVDLTYSKLLKTASWYDEVHAIRTEATHYLSGLIILSGEATLGYSNVPKSKRKGAPANQILVSDIEAHVKQLYQNFMLFLSGFGNHFVKIINQDSMSVFLCVSASDEVIGMRSILLKEILRHEEWKCAGSDDCPERTLCKTRKRGS